MFTTYYERNHCDHASYAITYAGFKPKNVYQKVMVISQQACSLFMSPKLHHKNAVLAMVVQINKPCTNNYELIGQ